MRNAPTRGVGSRLAATALLVCLPRLAGAQVPETLDPGAIPNYRLLRPGLAVGGAPSAETVARLKDLGFRTVIDLRTEGEPGAKEEAEAVEALGLTHLRVPVTAQSLSLDDAKSVASVLADAGAAPVLLHCHSSNRVGAVIALIEAQRGRSLEEALAEGKRAGLLSPTLIDAVKRLLEN